MLYLVALIRQPTKKQQEDGKLEEMVMQPTPIIARDEKAAAVQAVLKQKDLLGDDMGNVEVLVRPF